MVSTLACKLEVSGSNSSVGNYLTVAKEVKFLCEFQLHPKPNFNKNQRT